MKDAIKHKGESDISVEREDKSEVESYQRNERVKVNVKCMISDVSKEKCLMMCEQIQENIRMSLELINNKTFL